MMLSKPYIALLATLLVFYACYNLTTVELLTKRRPQLGSTEPGWDFSHAQDANTHSLSNAQCEAAFPRLFERIDTQTSRRQNKPIQLDDLDIPAGRCMLRVMIQAGQVRIVDLGDPLECYVSNGRERIVATLSLIHRAVVSSSEPVPTIEFPLSYDDLPTRSTRGVTWGFTRREEEDNVWLIPDYGYWSWAAIGVPSFTDLWMKMEKIESAHSWQEKIPKAVWRGTPHYAPEIRQKLVDIAQGKSWGDVKAVNQGESDASFLPLDDHCRYQYVFQTEGTSYSGRFKFLQLCKSITIAHKLHYSEFATHLLQANGPEQNFVETERDWSDLPRKMDYLAQNPLEAEAIARRSHELFNRRYLTPAAVSCYLRRLFHGWSEVQSFEPQAFSSDETTDTRKLRGMPFEAFIVSFPQDRPGEYGRFAHG